MPRTFRIVEFPVELALKTREQILVRNEEGAGNDPIRQARERVRLASSLDANGRLSQARDEIAGKGVTRDYGSAGAAGSVSNKVRVHSEGAQVISSCKQQ